MPSTLITSLRVGSCPNTSNIFNVTIWAINGVTDSEMITITVNTPLGEVGKVRLVLI